MGKDLDRRIAFGATAAIVGAAGSITIVQEAQAESPAMDALAASGLVERQNQIPTPEPIPTTSVEGQSNVRQYPNTQGAIVETINSFEQVDVEGQIRVTEDGSDWDWYRIILEDGSKGWMRKDRLNILTQEPIDLTQAVEIPLADENNNPTNQRLLDYLVQNPDLDLVKIQYGFNLLTDPNGLYQFPQDIVQNVVALDPEEGLFVQTQSNNPQFETGSVYLLQYTPDGQTFAPGMIRPSSYRQALIDAGVALQGNEVLQDSETPGFLRLSSGMAMVDYGGVFADFNVNIPASEAYPRRTILADAPLLDTYTFNAEATQMYGSNGTTYDLVFDAQVNVFRAVLVEGSTTTRAISLIESVASFSPEPQMQSDNLSVRFSAEVLAQMNINNFSAPQELVQEAYDLIMTRAFVNANNGRGLDGLSPIQVGGNVALATRVVPAHRNLLDPRDDMSIRGVLRDVEIRVFTQNQYDALLGQFRSNNNLPDHQLHYVNISGSLRSYGFAFFDNNKLVYATISSSPPNDSVSFRAIYDSLAPFYIYLFDSLSEGSGRGYLPQHFSIDPVYDVFNCGEENNRCRNTSPFFAS